MKTVPLKLPLCSRQAVETRRGTDLGKSIWVPFQRGGEQRLKGRGRVVQEGKGRLSQAKIVTRAVG